MRAVKHLVPLVLAAALLVGCDEPRPAVATSTATPSATASPSATPTFSAPAHPAPSGTAVVTSPTPAPSPTPRVWDRPPPSGVAHVDAIIAAVVSGNANALVPYVTGTAVPCGADPVCPPGVVAGTPTLAILYFGCPGGSRWDSLLSASRPTIAKELAEPAYHLRSVYRDPTGEYGQRYRILFQSSPTELKGLVLSLTDAGIAGISVWQNGTCAWMIERGGDAVIPVRP